MDLNLVEINVADSRNKLKITKVIFQTKHVQGFCYTQLTDIEQETNGVYLYDRNSKFNMSRIKKIFKGLSLKYKKDYIQ